MMTEFKSSIGSILIVILLWWRCNVLVEVGAAENESCLIHGLVRDGDKELPPVYDGPPKLLGDEFSKEYNMSAMDILREYCPLYEIGSVLCCDFKGLMVIKHQLSTIETFGFSRCPSCMRNFRLLICSTACDPRQSRYLKVEKTKRVGQETVATDIKVFISEKFAFNVYDSCKNVKGIIPGTSMMDTGVCGSWDRDTCTADRWLEFIGSTVDEGGYSDFKIRFVLSNNHTVWEDGDVFFPFHYKTTKCSEPAHPGDEACQCSDCEEACTVQQLFLPKQSQKSKIYFYQDLVVIVSAAILILVVVVFTVAFLKQLMSSKRILVVTQVHATSLKIIPNSENEETQHSSFNTLRYGVKLEETLQRAFSRWGAFVCRNPLVVMSLSIAVALGLSCGLLVNFKITTNPLDLWVSHSSEARQNMEYFNQHFGPFYRIQQVILTPKNRARFNHTIYPRGEPTTLTWGPVFQQDFLIAALDLQMQIEQLFSKNGEKSVVLKDICVSPLSPINKECAIMSLLGIFQNNVTLLKDVTSYLTHFKMCLTTLGDEKCFAPYGAPLTSSNLVLGGSEEDKSEAAEALITTFLIKNHYNRDDNEDALAWEKEYVKFLKNYSHPLIDVAFMSERSIQDELERGSQSDVITVAISYIIMLVYITLALGEFNGWKTIIVDSKISLGLIGVAIVLLSVTSALGIFCFIGVPTTLIILEVIPFLVLAVGVDNIFILVQAFQRDKRKNGENLNEQISRVVGQIAPSMLLSSASMISCFFIGGLTEMPAVKIFALCAGLSLVTNFFMQMTCFLALFALDAFRSEQRMKKSKVCCCLNLPDKNFQKPAKEGYIFHFFENVYSKFLMKAWVQYFVIIIFLGWFFSSVAVLDKINIGLEQELAVPKDSYMTKYFRQMNKYLSVGPPLYFVVTDGYDYSNAASQRGICSSQASCDEDSVVNELGWMAKQSNISYVALQPIGWFDTFVEFLRSDTCCFAYKENKTHCPSQTASQQKGLCRSCKSKNPSLLSKQEFTRRASFFLQDVPWMRCSKGGKAQFGSSVELITQNSETRIGATNFMTYHTVLKTSEDYYEALRWARAISANLTKKIASINPGVKVFPYSLTHPYYEQYLTMWPDTAKSLALSLSAIFIVTFLLLGLDLCSAVMVIVIIIMIVVNLLGLMYWWNISLNAVSLVNLVVAVGISVEFCSHLVRSFALSSMPTRSLRSQHALSDMGSSVLSGITLTDCGILFLAFAKSQIFQVFYFRMYLGIIAFGTLHSLILLPVLLSLVGPPTRKLSKAMLDSANGHEQKRNVILSPNKSITKV